MKQKKLSDGAAKLFLWLLPIVAAALIYCAVSFSRMEPYDAARLYMRTYSMMEHIMMSLMLIVAGGLLFDLEERHSS